MSHIYKHFYSLFNQEKKKLDRIISPRQDAPPASAFQTPLAVGAALLGLGVSSLLLGASAPRENLEDHPMCGITTGGQVSRRETGLKIFWLNIYLYLFLF